MPYLNSDACTRFAQKLVQTPSISTQEKDVADLVAKEMGAIGLNVRVDDMGNVIGHMGAGQGPALLFDAHMDTVDIGDPSSWSHPPFGGEISQGILYGRGACDMKGALAAMVYAAQSLKSQNAELKGDLYIVAVVQEEPCEGMAIRHVIEQTGIRPTAVILGEPTDLQLARGQRGRVEFQIDLQGQASHASAPQRGINAIYEAARIIVGLELLAPQLSHDPFLGQGSIAVTEITSTANSRNAVPDSCSLYIDRRLTADETETKARSELRRILTREGVTGTIYIPTYTSTSYTGYAIEARQVFPCWTTPANDRLLGQAARSVETTLGFVPRSGKWEFSTDGVYTAGVAGIPTVGFGPGEERYAHTADEQIRIQDILSAARVYADLASKVLQ